MKEALERGVSLPGDGFLYAASVEADGRSREFTPRVIPYHLNASVPLEAGEILWQK